jgi:hypothetical protein
MILEQLNIPPGMYIYEDLHEPRRCSVKTGDTNSEVTNVILQS